jgi:hypothetical protein
VGHERIGFLPKRKKWQSIIDQLSQFDSNDEIIKKIANQTLTNIRNKYKSLVNDESVVKAIKYLTILLASTGKENQKDFLMKNGIEIQEISLFNIINSAKLFLDIENISLESNKITVDALLNTLISYESSKQDGQVLLFNDHSINIWSNINSGAAFCELARGFFSTFTDRYLRYFLEREAANTINDYQLINSFSTNLLKLVDDISQNAFDTSKIMQSFAAGWFNNHAKEKIPSEKEIISFLDLSFSKMREELRREAEGK